LKKKSPKERPHTPKKKAVATTKAEKNTTAEMQIC
jgi:hypothetical protein